MAATILMAISDPAERDSWKQLLTDQGYTVIAVARGERVPDLCAHLRPDLVLLDAGLEDVPGQEICRRIKADSRNRLTPVVLMDALTEDSDLPANTDTDADDVWRSHPSRWEALERIQSLLQLKTYIDEQAEAVIVSLARTIEARDAYTRGHCDRIAFLAVRLGTSLGLSADQLDALRIAGIVHDVGKICVPDAILLKRGPLTDEEAAIIQQHPVEGERICAPLKSLRRVLPIVRHHHERVDGSGYPDGLRGEGIPLGARILQVVDIYDALTTDRPYRQAYSTDQAAAILYREAERGWLDADLVKAFVPAGAVPKSAEWADDHCRIARSRPAI